MPSSPRWQSFDVAHEPIIIEIEKQSDRGAAILATAFLEEQLTACIKASLADEPKIADPLFRGSGPLAALATKLDLGLLLGLYSKTEHRRLWTLRDIRNKFAHHVRPLSFETEDVAALCQNLPPPRRSKPPRITQAKDERLAESDPEAHMVVWLDWINSGPDTPRNRFLIAVRLNYFRFQLWLMIKNRTGQSPPPALPGKSPPRLSH